MDYKESDGAGKPGTCEKGVGKDRKWMVDGKSTNTSQQYVSKGSEWRPEGS